MTQSVIPRPAFQVPIPSTVKIIPLARNTRVSFASCSAFGSTYRTQNSFASNSLQLPDSLDIAER